MASIGLGLTYKEYHEKHCYYKRCFKQNYYLPDARLDETGYMKCLWSARKDGE